MTRSELLLVNKQRDIDILRGKLSFSYLWNVPPCNSVNDISTLITTEEFQEYLPTTK